MEADLSSGVVVGARDECLRLLGMRLLGVKADEIEEVLGRR
jgi:hypothetical protein